VTGLARDGRAEGNVLVSMNARHAMVYSCPGFVAVAAAVILAAVPGAAHAERPHASDRQNAGNGGTVVVVSLSLSKYTAVRSTDAGSTVGVKPDVVHVRVGDSVVFVNDDTDHHTATSLVAASTFVDDPRWTDDALRGTGDIGPGFWSTGDLSPGQRSAPMVARKAGTYLFGCFFDYGAGMRGEIVVEP
jgi:plastocyanin